MRRPLKIDVKVSDAADFVYTNDVFAAVVQYPNTHGAIHDWSEVATKTHDVGGILVVGTDLMALTKIKSAGDIGADIAFGNSQRFGVPMGMICQS